MPVSAELNAAREIVTYSHVYEPLEVVAARYICDAADAADCDARAEYLEESEALIKGADDFARAYLVSAVWTGVEFKDGDARADSDRDSDLSPDDIEPDTLREMLADCARFQLENAADLAAAIETGAVVCGPDFDEMGRAGHDFWLTRNGHGAGFWDGDWPEPYAERLSEAARKFGEYDLATYDDGRVGRL